MADELRKWKTDPSCPSTHAPATLTTRRLGPRRGSCALERVARKTDAVLAIFDRLFGAAVDARHAVGAVAPPNGSAALEVDVGERARADAHAARYTSIGNTELRRVDSCRIEQVIHDTASQPIHKRRILLG